MIVGHHSFVAVAFAHAVFCYRLVLLKKSNKSAFTLSFKPAISNQPEVPSGKTYFDFCDKW